MLKLIYLATDVTSMYILHQANADFNSSVINSIIVSNDSGSADTININHY